VNKEIAWASEELVLAGWGISGRVGAEMKKIIRRES